MRTDFTPSSFENAGAVALQGDGKIVVAGVVSIPGSGTSSDFALARYNADGTLDTSFDGDGKVVTNFASGIDSAFSVAVQTDGKIVAAGDSEPAGPGVGPFDFAVARYNPDGSLDPSFDGDGKVVTPISAGSDDLATVVGVQGDGKIVVGGYVYPQAGGVFSAVLVRYTVAGALDSSFDGDGRVVLTTPTWYVNGLALQRDGKVVTAGSPDFSVTRFNSNGSLDTSFGSGGNAAASFPSSAYSAAVAVRPTARSSPAAVALRATTLPWHGFSRAVALTRVSEEGTAWSRPFWAGQGVVTPHWTSGSRRTGRSSSPGVAGRLRTGRSTSRSCVT